MKTAFLVVENALSPGRSRDSAPGDRAALSRGSGGEIRRWERPDLALSDDEVIRQFLCIHFPHKISATMAEFLAHPAIVEVADQGYWP